jgi:hypothetical protein
MIDYSGEYFAMLFVYIVTLGSYPSLEMTHVIFYLSSLINNMQRKHPSCILDMAWT